MTLLAFSAYFHRTLWMGTLVALGVRLALPWVKSPRARYALALGGLFAAVLLPAFAVGSSGGGGLALLPALPAGWVAAMWTMGALFGALRLAGGALYLRSRPLGRALPIGAGLAAIAARLGIDAVRLREARFVEVPAVRGVRRPVVLMPPSAEAALTAPERDAVLAHELAHVARADVAVNAAQRVIEALFFFHPAVLWLSEVARAEREPCADALAVAAGADRSALARGLARLAGALSAPRLTVAAHGGLLHARVARLLDPQAPLATPRMRAGEWALAAGMLLAFVAGDGRRAEVEAARFVKVELGEPVAAPGRDDRPVRPPEVAPLRAIPALAGRALSRALRFIVPAGG